MGELSYVVEESLPSREHKSTCNGVEYKELSPTSSMRRRSSSNTLTLCLCISGNIIGPHLLLVLLSSG